jgi:hypothetical protein
MKLEVFEEILNKLRKQSDKQDALYALDVDLINYSDDHNSVINILLEVYYGKEGADWISWYMWERDENGDQYQATSSDGKPICYDDKSLWEEVEQCRLNNTKEYELPKKMSDEERLEVLKIMWQNGLSKQEPPTQPLDRKIYK